MHKRLDVRALDGRWLSILGSLGVPERVLNGRNQECPFCGGRDRFRFTNFKDKGYFFCNHCGEGDGVEFVRRWENTDFIGAKKKIEEIMPSAVAAPARQSEKKKHKPGRRWSEARPVAVGDPVWKYLRARRVLANEFPQNIRHEFRNGQHAMIARVTDWTGAATTVHLTYLTPDGKKAPLEVQKRVLSAMGDAPRIELFPASDVLCVAEGIETALAVRKKFDLPVWSLISTVGFKNFEPPPGLALLHICGDNDKGFAGQSAAYQLAERMATQHPELLVRVHIPNVEGTDWADYA